VSAPASLARRVWDRCHLEGAFVLRSGQTSNEYFDKFLLESDPQLLSEITAGMREMVPSGAEVLAGLELGGVPLATALSLATGLPALFVRKAAKTYGTCNLAEGGGVEGRLLVVVDDVVTAGGTIVESCRALRDLGGKVETVLAVIDREAGGADALAAEGLELRVLLKMSELRASASA
jgi:orotate phosphoribosyltransferase